jgi:thymidylate synthase ThyX
MAKDAGDGGSQSRRRVTAPEGERWLGRKLSCLDRGFIYLVDYMGSDAAIVQAARVSYGLGTKSVHEDRGLIRYLMRHQHTTPFEMVELKFHVKLPIFVARQWIRHRTACLGGETRLLFDLPDASAPGGRRPYWVRLADLHRRWHEARPLLSRMRLRMCDEASGEIRQTRVVDVWQTGVRPVFRVTLENGYAIEMTRDHRCLTERGWMTLGEATGLRRHRDDRVTWRRDAPALAVNGALASREPAPAPPRLVRGHSGIARIEFAGHEMTYDVAVSGPFHNFVANGFIVHNSVNEYSGRYSVMTDESYLPAPEHVSRQSAGNRQGGDVPLDPARAAEVIRILEEEQRLVRDGYQKMLGWDVRRELARINLGLAQYTEWYWKSDLHNIFHFLKLRLDPHAQYEIRTYAEAMAEIVRAVAPVAWEAFEDYVLHAAHLSRLECEALTALLGGPNRRWPSDAQVMAALPEAWREVNADGSLKRNRERDEFLAKLKRFAGRS